MEVDEMLRKLGLALTTTALAAGVLTAGAPAQADQAGVKAGVLTCDVASGWGFILGSSRDLKCSYSAGPGHSERYTGKISKFGVDIGYLQNGVIVWGVIAPTTSIAPGALAGGYGGVAGGASIGVGVDANALIGGFNKSITLQPVSFEGDKGVNVAAGIAAVSLTYVPGPYKTSSAP
jgi:hypothetical protein